MQSYLPLITGSGGALAVLAIVAWLFLTGKLHSDAEYTKLADENDDLKRALETERQANNELARAGGVTNKLIGALVELAADRHEHDSRQLERHRTTAREAAGISPEDLGLLPMRWPWRRAMRALQAEDQQQSEAEVSRDRLHRARRDVIEPLKRAAEQNRFAELLRQSLIDGRGGGT